MSNPQESPLDRLWVEYSLIFNDFDDITLARWLSQTLSQLQGRAWRMSHPLVGAYRLAAQIAYDRQIWLKRLATPPYGYSEAPCCRAPLPPLFTRDVVESGLGCPHCNGTAVPFEEIPAELQSPIKLWAEEYAPVHAIAHQDDRQRTSEKAYEKSFEDAAQSAERLLASAARDLVPKLAEIYPALLWEDHDECLEVRPEDIEL